jgi:hypothetical protein
MFYFETHCYKYTHISSEIFVCANFSAGFTFITTLFLVGHLPQKSNISVNSTEILKLHFNAILLNIYRLFFFCFFANYFLLFFC